MMDIIIGCGYHSMHTSSIKGSRVQLTVDQGSKGASRSVSNQNGDPGVGGITDSPVGMTPQTLGTNQKFIHPDANDSLTA